MQSQGQTYYDKLSETLKVLPGLPIVEIGTDGGTTAFWAMKALKDNNDKRWFFTIDPYGDKPYKAGDSLMGKEMKYNDAHYRGTLGAIKKYVSEHDLNHCHWKLTSLDWMKIWPQIEFWADGEVVKDRFAFAFLDGDHNWNPVYDEFKWFYERMPKGGVICIDDFNLLNGEPEVRLRFRGFEGEWFFNYDDAHYRCYFTKT